jgi:hypothetical protein
LDSSANPVTADELRKFMSMVVDKLKPIDVIKEMIDDFQKSMEFFNKQHEEAMAKLVIMETEHISQKKQISALEEKMHERDKVIANLERRLMDSEQYARNRNIEITGVECHKDENLRKIMENIADTIGVELHEKDIDVIHRLPTRRGDGPPRIVAQFASRTIRNALLKHKTRAIIISKDVVHRGVSDIRVYLNTHLTAEWKSLLWQAKQTGRPKGYTAIWFQDNKILAKKNISDARALVINSVEDLHLFG